MLTLAHGPLALGVDPEQGAACHGLTWTPPAAPAVELWRPWPEGSEVFEAASFALVPYSNRLFEGCLLSSAGPRHLPRNHARVECAVHGLGWRRAWQVLGQSPTQLRLAYQHTADVHWPFDHRAEQALSLGPSGLRVDLRLHNTGAEPMPAGMGLHPRFAIDEDDRLHGPGGAPQRAGDIVCNAGQAWGGWLSLERPACGLRLEMRADPLLAHLMVYRLPGQPWLCLEPVSHATGAFSRPELHDAAHGARELAPGQSMQAWVELQVFPLPRPLSQPH